MKNSLFITGMNESKRALENFFCVYKKYLIENYIAWWDKKYIFKNFWTFYWIIRKRVKFSQFSSKFLNEILLIKIDNLQTISSYTSNVGKKWTWSTTMKKSEFYFAIFLRKLFADNIDKLSKISKISKVYYTHLYSFHNISQIQCLVYRIYNSCPLFNNYNLTQF